MQKQKRMAGRMSQRSKANGNRTRVCSSGGCGCDMSTGGRAYLIPLKKAIGTPIAAGHGVAAIITASTRPHTARGDAHALGRPARVCHMNAKAHMARVKGVKSAAILIELRSSCDLFSSAAANDFLNSVMVELEWALSTLTVSGWADRLMEPLMMLSPASFL